MSWTGNFKITQVSKDETTTSVTATATDFTADGDDTPLNYATINFSVNGTDTHYEPGGALTIQSNC